MSIPKKKRREITVDDSEYHYCINYEKSDRCVIQHASGHGACLFIFPHAILKPKNVADAIRFGIKKGWEPKVKTQDIWLAFDADDNGNSLLEHIPNNDFRVVSYSTNGELNKNADLSKFSDTRKWYEREISPQNL